MCQFENLKITKHIPAAAPHVGKRTLRQTEQFSNFQNIYISKRFLYNRPK